MKWKRPLRMLSWIVALLLLLALVFVAVAFLPGRVEGNYRGRIVSSCACDGISFLNLRDGRMILYHSAHPPAEILGRYQSGPDGVELWLKQFQGHESEKLLLKAYPRFLITKFVDPSDGLESWNWKWPTLGRIGEALRTQEIASINAREGNKASREILGHDLKWIRHETKTGKNPWTTETIGLSAAEVEKTLQREFQQKQAEAVRLESEIADLKSLLEGIEPRLQQLETEKRRIAEEWKNRKLKHDAEMEGILEEPGTPLHEILRRMLERMERLTEENEKLKRRLEESSR